MADRYPNFKALAAVEKLGIDYSIGAENRATRIAVIAPHGGWIEPGTSEIARAIARDDLSLYTFDGLRPKRPHRDLHITSTRFDEPQALQFVAGAERLVAIHGRGDDGDPATIRMGGRDVALRDAIGAALVAAGFAVGIAEPKQAGREPENICNRGTAGAGVQLEIPRTLRDDLKGDAARMLALADAIRAPLI